jgi:uncharacterized protein YggT (Ycf19 family)
MFSWLIAWYEFLLGVIRKPIAELSILDLSSIACTWIFVLFVKSIFRKNDDDLENII